MTTTLWERASEMFACMVCGEPPGTESEMSEVIVTIDRPIELGLREPRTGIVHEQCLAEGETQALEEGLNWTVGGRWTQRGLVTLDETASRKPGVCAICDRELDPPIVLTGVGFVCRRCVSDLVTSFFARLDEVDPSGRRRVPLVPGTATKSQGWVSQVARGIVSTGSDSDDDIAPEPEELQGSAASSNTSHGVSLTIADPGGIVTTMSVQVEDRRSRYLINQVGPDGQCRFEVSIPVPSDGIVNREAPRGAHAVLVPHFILALRAVADDVLSEHLNGRL